jgi:outer membrane protein assembly factor BamB
MKNANRMVVVLSAVLLAAGPLAAQDWPQWRGPNRDAKVTGFKAPKTWPKELTRKWKVTVGDGVATPALVGDKLFVFSREKGSEVVRCLDAAKGEELWKESYEAQGATGPASGFAGPRCSPAVADGKVVTLGVRGTLSCLETSGKKLWRQDEFKAYPKFFTSSSPLVLDKLCIAQLGGGRGAIVAHNLETGKEKWKWSGDGTSYSSPAVMELDKKKLIIAMTEQNIVALDAEEGKLLWKTSFPSRMRAYNAATPIIDGQTIIYTGSGRGVKAVKLEMKDKEVTGKEQWSNSEMSVQYNTPVLKDGLIYGITERDRLYCINAKDGKTAWSTSSGGRRGYGSVVDAGPVLMSLTPSAQLIVFEPNAKEYKEVAKYPVGSDTYAYPIVSGNRVFVKDRDSVALWVIE